MDNENKTLSMLKKAIIWVGSISFIALIGSICFLLCRNQIDVESLLTILLAFFSMFIAFIFFFQAEDMSSKFYKSSYDFMKEVSVTLGQIQATFGEKLNNVNEKLAHLQDEKYKTSEKIDEAESEKKMFSELLAKAKISPDESEKYKDVIAQKDKDIAMLKEREKRLEEKYSAMIDSMDMNNSKLRKSIQSIDSLPLSEKTLWRLRNNDVKSLSSVEREIMHAMGFIDEKGEVNQAKLRKILVVNSRADDNIA